MSEAAECSVGNARRLDHAHEAREYLRRIRGLRNEDAGNALNSLAEFALPRDSAELLHERHVQGRELERARLQQLENGSAEG
jgi:hypothetical protein